MARANASKTFESDYDDDLEPDEQTEDNDSTPLAFWEKKQRELLTSTVDYNLETLSDLVDSGAINLKPKYQRRFRWDDIRQSRLIESFLMNVPVPPIFLNEDKYGQYSVIDGKQRLTAIHEFMKGRLQLKGLSVFADINGLHFDQLPGVFQNVIRMRPTLRAIIILRQSDPDIKFEVFQRLNTGGVKLNPQEIRNSAYPGPLNDLILDLSEMPMFHKLLGIKNKQRSRIFQEMRDAELVLRFFAFRENWDTFSGGFRRWLDMYMLSNQRPTKSLVKTLKHEFPRTLEVVQACFGANAFQRWQPEQSRWRKQVLASLYDAQMLACQSFSVEECAPRSNAIMESFKKLFEDQVFRRSIDSAINTPSLFVSRIETVKNLIASAVR